MTSSSEAPAARVGLRERKKARTRATIRERGLELFVRQGYAETTVEQIAEAADVSPSTFFRYFPSKDAVVMQDDLDDLLLERFHAQPAERSALEAIRGAMRELRTAMNESEWQAERARHALIMSVPELRGRMMDETVRSVRIFSTAIAARAGRSPDDIAVRTLAGAIFGVALSTMLDIRGEPEEDFLALLDAGLAQLERGLEL